MSKDIIIIPDVHGRTYWKDAIRGRENNDIIFLGDYLDPYPLENIDKEFAITNFEEIIEFKKAHMDNVTLLLGNHDFMTYISQEMGSCRTDFLNAGKIANIFYINRDLFKLGTTREVNGVKYSFTHAPILKMWVEDPYNEKYFKDVKDPGHVIRILQKLYDTKDAGLYKLLNQVSWCRGGYNDAGSSVWADVRECPKETPLYDGWYEIFGHTQLITEIIEPNFADLDCRAGFILNSDGVLQKIQ